MPHVPDDLDAGWDDSKPTNERVCAAIPGPAIGDIDAGWDLVVVGAAVGSPIFEAAAVDANVRRAKARAVPTSPKKKQLRVLERQARAHQLKRDSEARAKRKASPNTQGNEQRGLVVDRQPPAASHGPSAEEHSIMSNPQPKGSKRKTKAAKKTEHKASPPVSESVSQVTQSSSAAGTNRAMRRAGTAPLAVSRSASTHAEQLRSTKRPAIGPFTLFIGVVLVASIFSYLFIR